MAGATVVPISPQRTAVNRAFFFLPLLLFFFCLLLAAQDTATIMDAVADPSGAMIPGVKVTVSNPDKGFTRELESNSAGEYMAAKVPIGNYVITAGAPGFLKLARSGFTLTVGQTLRLDLQLTFGQFEVMPRK